MRQGPPGNKDLLGAERGVASMCAADGVALREKWLDAQGARMLEDGKSIDYLLEF